MNEASFASLSPTLLARKGGAKPAMRPQLAPIPDASVAANEEPANLEDLGWNDMGEEAVAEAALVEDSAEVVQLKPVVVAAVADPIQQDNAPVVKAPAKPAKKRRSALKQGKRAAFTLRLDQDRHLKLRLAATMQETSAQELVTQALDALLGDIAELDQLAAQMKKD